MIRALLVLGLLLFGAADLRAQVRSTSSAIDLTAANFLQITVATLTNSSASNSFTGRLLSAHYMN